MIRTFKGRSRPNRWSIAGISKGARDDAMKMAEKEEVTVSEYVERALLHALDVHENCEAIADIDDLQGVTEHINGMQKRLKSLEKVAANSERLD